MTNRNYYAEAQKRYNTKRKKLAANVPLPLYESIIEHMHRKGFTSVNSYILYLVKQDLNKDSFQDENIDR